MKELPFGWEWAELQDVAEIIQGQSPSSSSFNDFGEGVPFFQGKAEFGDLYPQVRKWTTSPHKEAQTGDILISIRAPVGPTNIASTRCAIGRGLAAIRTDAEISTNYILWSLRASCELLAAKATGSTFTAISGSTLRAHQVPIAPATEQRRIVAALEGYLSQVGIGINSISATSSRLHRLISAMREHSLLTRGHTWGKLGDLIHRIEAGKSFAAEGRPASATEWGIIKVSAMTWGEFRENENKALFPTQEFDFKNEIHAGDILVSRANTEQYVGAPVLVKKTRPRLLLSDKSLRLVPKEDVDPDWLLEILSSSIVRKQISKRATGTKDGMRNISQSALRDVDVPIVQPDHQRALAKSINLDIAGISQLRSKLAETENLSRTLYRSVLTEAFSGRLVRQDRGDEPAAILLARIKDKRTAAPKSRRNRRVARQSEVGSPAQETLL